MDNINYSLEEKLKKDRVKNILKYVLIALSIALIIVLAILLIDTKKDLKVQKATTEKALSDHRAQKAIVDTKSNCDVCPALAETTTAPKTIESPILLPPAPPSD